MSLEDLDPISVWIFLAFLFGGLFCGATILGLCFGRWNSKLKTKADKGCLTFFYHCSKAGRIFLKPFAMIADWLSDLVILLEMYQHGANNLMYLSIGTLVFHLVTSAFITYLDQPKYSKTRITQPILQLLNLRIVYEVWRSAKLGRATYNLNEIRLMEAIFEAIPQMTLQVYFLFQYGSGNFWENPMIMGSVICSVLNAAITLNYFDYYGLASEISHHSNRESSCHAKAGLWFQRFWILLFRYSDIQLRTISLGAIAYKYSARITVLYFVAFSSISYITTLCARHTNERRSLVQDLQITLLTCFCHDFYDDGLTRFYNIWKIVEKIVLVIIISEAFNTTIKRILLVNTVVYLVTLLSIQYYSVVDVKAYRNVRDRNKDHLFKSKNFEVIIRLLKRKEIKLRDVKQSELRQLQLYGLRIEELIYAGYKDEKLLQIGFTLKELKFAAAIRLQTSRKSFVYLPNMANNLRMPRMSLSTSRDKSSKNLSGTKKDQKTLSAFLDNEDIENRDVKDLQKEGKRIGYLRCKFWDNSVPVDRLAQAYTLKALRKIRVSPKELLEVKEPRITMREIFQCQYFTEPHEIVELFDSGLVKTLEELADAGYNVLYLLDGTLEKEDFEKYGITIQHWIRHKCSKEDLRRAGYPKSEISQFFSERLRSRTMSLGFDNQERESDSENEDYRIQKPVPVTLSPETVAMVPFEFRSRGATYAPDLTINVHAGEISNTEYYGASEVENDLLDYVSGGENLITI